MILNTLDRDFLYLESLELTLCLVTLISNWLVIFQELFNVRDPVELIVQILYEFVIGVRQLLLLGNKNKTPCNTCTLNVFSLVWHFNSMINYKKLCVLLSHKAGKLLTQH